MLLCQVDIDKKRKKGKREKEEEKEEEEIITDAVEGVGAVVLPLELCSA